MPETAATRAASILVTMPPVPADLHFGERVLHVRHVADASRSGFAWGCRVERVHVGEEHQSVGDYDVGDQCGESVVVSETDFVGREGIVFVDDRHRAEVEQPVEGASHVAVLLWCDGVGHGDEDLPDAQSVL